MNNYEKLSIIVAMIGTTIAAASFLKNDNQNSSTNQISIINNQVTANQSSISQATTNGHQAIKRHKEIIFIPKTLKPTTGESYSLEINGSNNDIHISPTNAHTPFKNQAIIGSNIDRTLYLPKGVFLEINVIGSNNDIYVEKSLRHYLTYTETGSNNSFN